MLQKKILKSILESLPIQRRPNKLPPFRASSESRLCTRRLFYTQPWSQIAEFFKSRQGMTCSFLSKTASISTSSITPSGNSGRMTLLTRKCFRLWLGFTAVHLLRSSFLGLRGFWSLEGIALKFICVANEFAWARCKDIACILGLSGALQIKITLRTKTSTVIILAI